jgi:hypothetical protein
MSIRQINGVYDSVSDRLLIRLNTKDHCEYSFWFTRRVSLQMLSVINHVITRNQNIGYSRSAAQLIAEFNKESHLLYPESRGFSCDDVYERGSKHPYGIEPVLVSEVSFFSEKEKEVDVLIIQLMLNDKSHINLKLAEQNLEAFSYLLERLYQNSSGGKLPKGLNVEHTEGAQRNHIGIDNKGLLH